jgi:hypothetical protein
MLPFREIPPNWEFLNSSIAFKISGHMNREGEESVKKIIRFRLAVSETGEEEKSTLQGIINYEFGDGLIFVTDYPLKPGNVLQLSEKINGRRNGVVKRVAECGKAYMVHIDFN